MAARSISGGKTAEDVRYDAMLSSMSGRVQQIKRRQSHVYAGLLTIHPPRAYLSQRGTRQRKLFLRGLIAGCTIVAGDLLKIRAAAYEPISFVRRYCH